MEQELEVTDSDIARYDMDHDDDVLYCYEIQTEQKMRRKGLGKSRLSSQDEKCYSLY